jgi:CO dehydrogenase/acetyl-CoA synthase alpha subunit
MTRKPSTKTSAPKRARTSNQRTEKQTQKTRPTTTRLVTRAPHKEGETMVTESVKEMINMMPQMTTDPTEMLRETTKVWTRGVELATELTGKLGDEMWNQSMKSYDETQKMYRTHLETLHSWTSTWRTQTQQNLQRFIEMTNTPWK